MIFSTSAKCMTKQECECLLTGEDALIQATHNIIGDSVSLERYTTVYIFNMEPVYSGRFNTNSFGFEDPQVNDYEEFYCKFFDCKYPDCEYSFQICCYVD